MNVLSKTQKNRRGIPAEVPRGRHHRVDGAEQRLGALTRLRRDQLSKIRRHTVSGLNRGEAYALSDTVARDRTNGNFDKEVSSKKRVFC